MYRYKYLKYKSKFIQAGGFTSGFYRDKNKKMIKVIKTKENKYVSFTEESNLSDSMENMLYIDSVEAFDDFTKKYAGIQDLYTPHPSLYIRWDKVARDYEGFHINKNNRELYLMRYSYAQFKNQRILSWWQGEYNRHMPIRFIR